MNTSIKRSMLAAVIMGGVLLSATASARNAYRCSELTWEQAQELLLQGHTYLDRDNDGEACEGNR